ncbi:MAG: helix-turn-helix transcriptional regulator [Haliscomenobacter sp.]|uniref:helix-turn-helix transcriptional regulator n=1 Tax=Haliscomenobacter sp. TaxID=2717303 RepID=UPI0029B534DD|nr:helix-turn-helix transcriptional regulator [Haliscomenobacter sp.]MDX2069291.1 helix-turn-helix transcriptional regulator [Haliscomenobacter sp.]
MSTLSKFVKERRKKLGLTQQELAERAGLGLRFVREVEQGKTTLKMDKVNQLLSMFGHELAPIESKREKYTNEQANHDQ